MINLFSFISGLVFAMGLAVSGMINPDKVIGFLDLFGNWDYALAFVMGGAVLFNGFSFYFIFKRHTPVLCNAFNLPQNKIVDKKLVLGAVFFGIGWGLIGICPGPGIVNLVTFNPKIIVFLVSMLLGMMIFKGIERKI